jgi:hypothetical protein
MLQLVRSCGKNSGIQRYTAVYPLVRTWVQFADAAVVRIVSTISGQVMFSCILRVVTILADRIAM